MGGEVVLPWCFYFVFAIGVAQFVRGSKCGAYMIVYWDTGLRVASLRWVGGWGGGEGIWFA